MSDFGSSGVASSLIIAGVFLVPIVGWGALIGTVGLGIGYTFLMVGANQQFYPDGTRRPQARRKGSGRR